MDVFGESGYRTKQIRYWIYRKLVTSFDEMTNLPKGMRERIDREAVLCNMKPVHESEGHDGTVKTLFSLHDGKTVESTLMHSPSGICGDRYTVCVSSQVGCAIGCPFCATGQQGFERNLSPGEIIGQVLYYARRLRDRVNKTPVRREYVKSSISNLVFMGMGEPLANYSVVLQAVDILNAADGFGLGARNMVISTAGLVPQIKRLASEKYQVGLAVSLHASDDVLRDGLVPMNKKYPLDVLIPACRDYVESTRRRISFEYALFAGVNDSVRQACSLARLVSGINCHINLITANNTASRVYRSPKKNNVLAFEEELRSLGINCTLRESKGTDIEAGCGQLRSRFLRSSTKSSSIA